MKICKRKNCGRPVHCWGLCNRHRMQLSAKRARVNRCKCGCGGLTQWAFVAGHQTRLFSRAEQRRRGRMNDGSTQRDRYSKDTYRKWHGRHEHRVAMERKLGRRLRPGEIVHHKDGDKRNNRLSNLQLMTQSDHIREHHKDMMKARLRKCGY